MYANTADAQNDLCTARIAQRAGDKAAAMRYGEMAIAKTSPQQADLAAEIRRNVDNWKK